MSEEEIEAEGLEDMEAIEEMDDLDDFLEATSGEEVDDLGIGQLQGVDEWE